MRLYFIIEITFHFLKSSCIDRLNCLTCEARHSKLNFTENVIHQRTVFKMLKVVRVKDVKFYWKESFFNATIRRRLSNRKNQF